MFPDSAATIAGMYREYAPPPDLAAAPGLRVDERRRGRRASCPTAAWTSSGTATDLVIAGPGDDRARLAARPGPGVRGALPARRRGRGARAAGRGARRRARAAGRRLGPDGDDAGREAAALRGLPGLIDALRRAPARVTDPLARAAALRLAVPGRARRGAGALGISERQLRRRFADAVGYGPKTLARVLRFQRFLTLAGGGDDLARLAFAAGYSDQAHLTRECRRLAGRTPAELVAAGAPGAIRRRG